MDLQEEVKLKRSPNVLQVITWPDPLLSKISNPFTDSIPHSPYLQDLLDDMVVTMNAYRGAGLAAIQIGIPFNIFVARNERGESIKVINPVIKEIDGTDFGKEGCLSVPGVFEMVRRPKEVVLEYFDEKGELKTQVWEGLLARVACHEADHSHGTLFFDRINKIQRSVALNKYRKIIRKRR